MTDQPRSSHQFKPGQSGNPAGRPRGTRNRVLLALDRIGGDAAADILNKAVELARGGDLRAAELILSRCWPARRGRPVKLADMPEIQTVTDLVAAMGVVTSSVAAGDLSPDEGAAIATILEWHRRTLETADLAQRIEALEAQQEPQQ